VGARRMLFRHAGVVMARASTDPGELDLPDRYASASAHAHHDLVLSPTLAAARHPVWRPGDWDDRRFVCVQVFGSPGGAGVG
jgi:hypothetical protein